MCKRGHVIRGKVARIKNRMMLQPRTIAYYSRFGISCAYAETAEFSVSLVLFFSVDWWIRTHAQIKK